MKIIKTDKNVFATFSLFRSCQQYWHQGSTALYGMPRMQYLVQCHEMRVRAESAREKAAATAPVPVANKLYLSRQLYSHAELYDYNDRRSVEALSYHNPIGRETAWEGFSCSEATDDYPLLRPLLRNICCCPFRRDLQCLYFDNASIIFLLLKQQVFRVFLTNKQFFKKSHFCFNILGKRKYRIHFSRIASHYYCK